MNLASRVRLLTACLVLAAGCGAVWGVGAGGIGTYLLSLISGPQIYESIEIALDGTPLIHASSDNSYNYELRTLDGKLVERRQVFILATVPLFSPYRAPGIVNWPVEWSQRIGVMPDEETSPVFWALIRDAELPGKLYLAGYDSITKHNVGYLGRDGLRAVIPPVDEWFDIGFHKLQYVNNAIATDGNFRWTAANFDTNYPADDSPVRFKPWMIFVCDGNTIREIDLREREVRAVATFERLVGVQTVEIVATEEPQQAPFKQVPMESRLLVRTADRILLYNTFDRTQVEFKIPREFENETFKVTILGTDQLLLHVNRGHWERGNVIELQTINPNGEVVHRETVRLVNYVQPTRQRQSLQVASIAPVLLLWVVGMLLVAPLINNQNLRADTFQQGLDQAVEAWPGLLIVAVLSIVLAVIVYRWQQKYSRANTGLWTTFVFLTTLPGFLAYWVMHRREPLGKCVHCGANVPQDRDVCAKCATPLPEPNLLGTEIFA